MLGQLFIFLFFICTSQSCFQGDNANYKTPTVFYVLNGEPFFVICPLEPFLSSDNVTWFKNGSQTEISSDIQERIHQDSNYLKFIPTRLEDSGFYACGTRNSTECEQEIIQVEVFQNDDGLCYRNGALYRYKQVLMPSLTIECPYVSDMVDIMTVEFQWFKECKPLDLTTDANKYLITQHKLNIKEATSRDGGVYTCVTSFLHNGTKYEISRSIDYAIYAMPLIKKPIILYPTGNSIDAELGAPVTVTCKALYSENFLSWTYNGSFIEYYDDSRVTEGTAYDSVTKDGQKVSCQNVTFSSVKKEDYGLKFYCEAESLPENSIAFFTLKPPDPNFQGFLIAFFVTVVFFIITTIIVVKVFKVDLVLWYRSSCFSHPHQNDGKMYDAYIMYPRNATGSSAYDMDLFVLKLLPEVLEIQCAYRLFIIGRDDIPGQAMADLVDQAISQSRRLIIVLGQVSNKDNLGEDFEQKIAMYDALIRNEIKVILIEMEKITDYSFMPESIKYIRQKQGVVRWKETFTEASLSPKSRFWKNIRYRMPPVPRHSDKELDDIHKEDV